MVLSQYEKAVFNHPHYKSLYNQREFKTRKNLRCNKYFILAHLVVTEKHSPYHIASINPNEQHENPNLGFINITKRDSSKILKFKFRDPIKNNLNHYNNTFVPQFRRILGHILFCSGTLVSISMIAFNKNSYYQNEYIRPYYMAYAKFDDIPNRKAVSNTKNSALLAMKTINLGNSDYLLDRAIMLSGEAIGAWHIQELSLFSAWRSIETMAKRKFRAKMVRRNVKLSKMNDDWNYSGTTRAAYVDSLLANKKIGLKSSDTKTYRDLRNYIGHGSVNIKKVNIDMVLEDFTNFAKINSRSHEVITLSRKLIRNTLRNVFS